MFLFIYLLKSNNQNYFFKLNKCNVYNKIIELKFKVKQKLRIEKFLIYN